MSLLLIDENAVGKFTPLCANSQFAQFSPPQLVTTLNYPAYFPPEAQTLRMLAGRFRAR